MIFVHAAIFPEKLCPRQTVVNGSVLMEGQKMSKSLGNIIPLREAIPMFGADPLRMASLATAELLQDADFSPALARSMRDRLERFYRFAVEATQVGKEAADEPLATIDKWMISRLQERVRMATEAMDKLLVRRAIHSALYMLDQDFQWYLRRIAGVKETPERRGAIAKVFSEVLDAQVRMLAPLAPHICEEIWEKMGREGFVSLTAWPTHSREKVDAKAEESEALIESVLEDTQNIVRATGITPQKIRYYVAAPWKWEVYLRALERSVSARVDLSDFMKELMKDPELKRTAGAVAKFVHQAMNEINQTSDDEKRKRLQIGIANESRILEEAEMFLERELSTEAFIYSEEDPRRYDPKKRAELARPYRPAIYIE